MTKLAALLTLLLPLAALQAQCPNGQCTTPAYTWRTRPDCPDESYLYKGTRQIGGYHHAQGVYLPLLCDCGDQCHCTNCNCPSLWGAPRQSPIAPPVANADSLLGKKLTGVEWDKINKDDSYTINGQEVTRKQAIKALKETKLADDSNKPHLTYIARSERDRKQFAEACKTPELAGLCDKFRVQTYDPANEIDAAILEPFDLDADQNFAETGKMLVLQKPAVHGKSKADVIYQFTTAQLADELRKKDAEWNPAKPILPDRPLIQPKIEIEIRPWAIIATIAGAAAIVLIAIIAMTNKSTK